MSSNVVKLHPDEMALVVHGSAGLEPAQRQILQLRLDNAMRRIDPHLELKVLPGRTDLTLEPVITNAVGEKCDEPDDDMILQAVRSSEEVLLDAARAGVLPASLRIGATPAVNGALARAEKTDPYRAIPADEFMRRPRPSWLIRDILPACETAMLFGAPESGKSFLALDMLMALQTGTAWRGHRVKSRYETRYLAAEDSGGAVDRLRALAKHYGLSVPADLPHVIPAAPNLRDPKTLEKFIQSRRADGPIDVLMIDTLSRVLFGDDNSAQDSAEFLASCQKISKATGATVVLIHHSGKDASRGARGSSNWMAGVDAAIEVSRSEFTGERSFRVVKQKNGFCDRSPQGFTLLPVPVDADDDGEPITSCVVQHDLTAAPARTARTPKPRTPRGASQRIVYKALQELGAGGNTVAIVDLVDLAAKSVVAEPGQGARRDNLRRAVQELVTKDFARLVGPEDVCLPGPVKVPAADWIAA
jgi:archaellum biogenesis ATPase FlaH